MKIFKVLRVLERAVAFAPLVFSFFFFGCKEPKTRGVGSRKSCTIRQMRLRLRMLLPHLRDGCLLWGKWVVQVRKVRGHLTFQFSASDRAGKWAVLATPFTLLPSYLPSSVSSP